MTITDQDFLKRTSYRLFQRLCDTFSFAHSYLLDYTYVILK